jgi:hypothetical protein
LEIVVTVVQLTQFNLRNVHLRHADAWIDLCFSIPEGDIEEGAAPVWAIGLPSRQIVNLVHDRSPNGFRTLVERTLNVRFEQFVVETYDCVVDEQDQTAIRVNLEGTRLKGGPAANSVIDRWDWLDVVSRLQDLFPETEVELGWSLT